MGEEKKVAKKDTKGAEIRDILMEEVEEITGWEVKPLSLAGTARLIHFLADTLDDAAQRMSVEKALDDEAIISPVVSLVRMFGEDKLADLLGIITGKSKAWVTKNWSLKLASKAIRDFIEKEEMGEVLGNLGGSRDLLMQALAEGGSPGS